MGMSINEAAQKTGLTPKAIRFYEASGLIYPDRHANNYRTYSGVHLANLRAIKLARDCGFSIAETKVLLFGEEDAAEQLIERRAETLQELRGALTGGGGCGS